MVHMAQNRNLTLLGFACDFAVTFAMLLPSSSACMKGIHLLEIILYDQRSGGECLL